MSSSRKKIMYLLAFFFLAVSAVLRWLGISHLNVDMSLFYVKIYQYILAHGLGALADNFSLGTPLYLYTVWVATLTHGFLTPPVALKLVSMTFDLLSALAIAKMVFLKYKEPSAAFLAAAIFLCLPTVIANSSLWGQIDSMYVSFLLWCVYYLMVDRPLPAMVAFGLSISIKLQAVFLIPFLLVMLFKRRIHWHHFLVPPAVYVLTILPAVLMGRPFFDALTIYLSWPGEFLSLAMHAANLYSLLGKHSPKVVQILYFGGLVMTVVVLGAWIFYYARRRFLMSPRLILLTAFMSVVLTPFVMPKMHDRYFYPADNLSYALAFFFPGYWYIVVGYQIISGLLYYIFLYSVTSEQNTLILTTSVLLNTAIVFHLIIRQWLETRENVELSTE